jgi:NAD(P)-dependent dehydrogenase (short-subunit alcohol dehydrogenase family)
MNTDDKTILTTGANRGIGLALGEETLRRGVMRVYAVTPAAANDSEEQRRRYVPSMHRKHSINGRRSRIHGRSSGAVYRQVQKTFQSE